MKNGIVYAARIYGLIGMVKSNLGLAIFDIIEHLTDQRREERSGTVLNMDWHRGYFSNFGRLRSCENQCIRADKGNVC